MLAAFSGQLGSVQELRRHGADPRLTDRGGSTAFHWAVDSGTGLCTAGLDHRQHTPGRGQRTLGRGQRN